MAAEATDESDLTEAVENGSHTEDEGPYPVPLEFSLSSLALRYLLALR